MTISPTEVATSQAVGPNDQPALSQVASQKVQPSSRVILFYDGQCGLCQKSVQFVLRRQPQGSILFAPLQGTTAAEMLPLADREQLDSMVVAKNGQLFRHSTAALAIAQELGGFWKMLGHLGSIIPRPLRDLIYRAISRNRYRMFGQADACRLPQPGERERFLD